MKLLLSKLVKEVKRKYPDMKPYEKVSRSLQKLLFYSKSLNLENIGGRELKILQKEILDI